MKILEYCVRVLFSKSIFLFKSVIIHKSYIFKYKKERNSEQHYMVRKFLTSYQTLYIWIQYAFVTQSTAEHSNTVDPVYSERVGAAKSVH
jgi:hypothetical protein